MAVLNKIISRTNEIELTCQSLGLKFHGFTKKRKWYRTGWPCHRLIVSCKVHKKKRITTLDTIKKNTKGKCFDCWLVELKTQKSKERYERFRVVVNTKGGTILNEYVKKEIERASIHCGDCKWKWEPRIHDVTHGRWCPNCGQNRKILISEAKAIAKELGGKLLSKKMTSTMDQLNWVCILDHTFSRSYDQVKRKHDKQRWCPICIRFPRENYCRAILEGATSKVFSPSKLSYIKDGKKYWVELDGLCSDLKLAFEHNGEQHYNTNAHYSHQRIGINDKIKKKLCKKNNISLIVIPYWIESEKIKNYIESKLIKLGVTPNKIYKIKLSTSSSMQEIEKYVLQMGGKIIAGIAINNSSVLSINCGKGHPVWKPTIKKLRNKQWCPYCRGNKVVVDRDKILGSLKDFYSKRYKSTTTEWENERMSPSLHIIRKTFGSWETALVLAGVKK